LTGVGLFLVLLSPSSLVVVHTRNTQHTHTTENNTTHAPTIRWIVDSQPMRGKKKGTPPSVPGLTSRRRGRERAAAAAAAAAGAGIAGCRKACMVGDPP
jgi:hypothetical protein